MLPRYTRSGSSVYFADSAAAVKRKFTARLTFVQAMASSESGSGRAGSVDGVEVGAAVGFGIGLAESGLGVNAGGDAVAHPVRRTVASPAVAQSACDRMSSPRKSADVDQVQYGRSLAPCLRGLPH